MTTPDIQQAKEWVTYVNGQRDLYGDKSVEARAAARVIQSLPDQWIDAEKVREIYDRYRASETTLHEAFRAAVALATPPLSTLADMTAEEQEACQWMQAKVFLTASTLGIITSIDGYTRSAIILFTDGMAKNVPWSFITPLPGLPKLEWPSDGVVDAGIVEDDEPIMMPRPEDVPPGEWWSVRYYGKEWAGVRADHGIEPWSIIGMDRLDYRDVDDSEITLISRLVPEAKP